MVTIYGYQKLLPTLIGVGKVTIDIIMLINYGVEKSMEQMDLIDSIDKKYVFPKVFLKLIFFQIDFSLEKNLPLKIILVTKNYHSLNYYHNY